MYLQCSVLICLVSMTGAHVINTNFGSIEVMDLNIDDSNGNNIACTIYRPKQQLLKIRLLV